MPPYSTERPLGKGQLAITTNACNNRLPNTQLVDKQDSGKATLTAKGARNQRPVSRAHKSQIKA